MEINKERFLQADTSLYYISLAADNIACLAEAMTACDGDDQVRANALHFTAHYLHEETAKVRELLFGQEEAE